MDCARADASTLVSADLSGHHADDARPSTEYAREYDLEGRLRSVEELVQPLLPPIPLGTACPTGVWLSAVVMPQPNPLRSSSALL